MNKIFQWVFLVGYFSLPLAFLSPVWAEPQASSIPSNSYYFVRDETAQNWNRFLEHLSRYDGRILLRFEGASCCVGPPEAVVTIPGESSETFRWWVNHLETGSSGLSVVEIEPEADLKLHYYLTDASENSDFTRTKPIALQGFVDNAIRLKDTSFIADFVMFPEAKRCQIEEWRERNPRYKPFTLRYEWMISFHAKANGLTYSTLERVGREPMRSLTNPKDIWVEQIWESFSWPNFGEWQDLEALGEIAIFPWPESWKRYSSMDI